jgi:hypothetical protein
MERLSVDEHEWTYWQQCNPDYQIAYLKISEPFPAGEALTN